MMQRQKLLKDMRTRTVSSEISGTSFLAPLTIDSIKKLNSGASFSKGGMFSGIRVGQSEKSRPSIRDQADDTEESSNTTEDFTCSTTLLKQLATENAALQLKLEAVAQERNRYRDQILSNVREASRKSIVCEVSSQTDPPEVGPETVDKKIVDKLKEKIEVLQNRYKEMVMLNDLLELKIVAAVAHEKESNRSWEAQLKQSASLLEEQEEQSIRDLEKQKCELINAFEEQTKKLNGVCEEQRIISMQKLADDLIESAKRREEDKALHADQVKILEEELEIVRSVIKALPDPSKCNEKKNILKALELFKSFKSDYIADKKFTIDMVKKFDDHLRITKEEMRKETFSKFEADAAQYALNLKLKDCESKNLFGRLKILDGLLCTAMQSKTKILCQVKCLSERATSSLADIIEKHALVVQGLHHEAHVKDLSRITALREAALERDQALDELQHIKYVIPN